MFLMCGYDFLRDANALSPAPLQKDAYAEVTLSNGIFDHWNVTKDVTSSISTEIPTEWEILTIMNANFEGNIKADNLGSLSDILADIDGVKIKRRKTTDFDWITIKYIPVETVSDLSFVFQDNLAQSNVEYEYAYVPVSGGIEGNYVTERIASKFDGVFICDVDTIYKFYSGVSYGNTQRVQKVGVLEPLGRQYPVIMSNGLLNYNQGSFSGKVIPNDFYENKILNSLDIIKENKALNDFLTNKKAKILKDWNGNQILMIITNSPTTSYDKNSGMKMLNVSASWTEIGDANNQRDLYNSGLIEEIQ